MHNIAEALRPLAVDIDSLSVDERNARTHPQENLDALKRSLEHYGQRKPIVVRAETRTIEAGNGMWPAARDLGWTEIAALLVDDDPTDATGFAIMDNQSALLSDWDGSILKDPLEELDTGAFDMALTGFTDDALADLMAQTHGGRTDSDAVPDDVEPVCQVGDLWRLGSHRLMCGDATNSADIVALMDGANADALFTDPPYGIGIVKGVSPAAIGGAKPFGRVRPAVGRASGVLRGKVGGPGVVEPRLYRPVYGDDKPFDPQPFLDMAPTVLLFGGNHYASRLPDTSGWLVWDKNVAAESTFSACELVWCNIGEHIRRYEHTWSGMVRAGARSEELRDRVHPTQKPVGLLAAILLDYSEDEAGILDPFGGSGSTLIACEKLGRRCYMMEIDPLYCDIIIKRWEDYTGQKAEKVNAG